MEPIRECLECLMSEDEGVVCLITDAQWPATQNVADELKLPRIVHRTSSVASFLSFAAFPLLHDMRYFRQFSDQGILKYNIKVLNSLFILQLIRHLKSKNIQG